jgi:type VII secretion protein EccB
MPNRRDQYQGYRFASRRQAGALLRADLDTADGPLRRLSGGVVASVTLAVLAMVCAGLFGLISPSGGSKSWEDGKSLIVDAQTGSRYVFLDGRLHPILNYASALLILKNGAVGATRVNDGSVNSVPHGGPVGIPGAPDLVPGPGSLMSGTWSVCSSPAIDSAAEDHPLVQATLGAAPGGSALPSGTGLLVEDLAHNQYLVLDNAKFAIPAGANYVLTALGASAASPLVVGSAFLNAVPQGPNFAAPAIDGRGAPGPAVSGAGGTKIGEVFQMSGTGADYVLLSGGLAPITALQALLLETENRQGTVTQLGAAEIQSTPRVGLPGQSQGSALPSTAPKVSPLASATTEVCVQQVDPSQGTVTISTKQTAEQTLKGTPVPPVDPLGAPLADTVSIPSGKGALVRATPQPNVATGQLFLVTDLGVKYPVESESALGDLGLGKATVSQVSQPFAALIPTGPVLAESAALAQQYEFPPGATLSASP